MLSGDIDDDDSQTPVITDLTSVTCNTTRGANVVMGLDVDSPALNGFTIIGGYASIGLFAGGGGILVESMNGIRVHLTLSAAGSTSGTDHPGRCGTADTRRSTLMIRTTWIGSSCTFVSNR